MFDSHCHVTDIEDTIGCLVTAKRLGVDSVLVCGYRAKSNQQVLELRRTIVGLPIAIGLHPWYVDEPLEPVLHSIERERPIAIGECGLDGFLRDSAVPPLASQYPAFEAQLDLALRCALPVTVHSRWAANEVIAMLRRYPRVRGVLHAYSGSYEQVEPLLANGWLVGLGGAMTRPASRRIRRLAEQLSLEHVLFETDAPTMALEGVGSGLVRPEHVVRVAQSFAALRGLEYQEVVEQTDRNARRLFGDSVFAQWTSLDVRESRS